MIKTRLLDRLTNRAWITANALVRPFGRGWWVDAIVVFGLGATLFGLLQVAREWTGVHRPAIEIDLSPWALPAYTFFSMVRGLLAYVISLGFTLVYAYWAAHDRRAEKVLVPLLDILQSIPVLGFMPGLVLALVAVFPRTNLGLELAAVIMIFTGQAWNMTFSLYHSLKSVPQDIKEASLVYRFTRWERFKWMELPYGTTGLVWNSMMSMAGGWFFLMINEAFRLGDHGLPAARPRLLHERGGARGQARGDGHGRGRDHVHDRDPGPVALAAGGRLGATLPGGGDHRRPKTSRSWFLDLLRRSGLVRRLRYWRRSRSRHHRGAGKTASVVRGPSPTSAASRPSAIILQAALGLLLAVIAWGALRLVHLLAELPLSHWGTLTLVLPAAASPRSCVSWPA